MYEWNHDTCYKSYAIFDDSQWLRWYNGRHGGVEQIGLVNRVGEDPCYLYCIESIPRLRLTMALRFHDSLLAIAAIHPHLFSARQTVDQAAHHPHIDKGSIGTANSYVERFLREQVIKLFGDWRQVYCKLFLPFEVGVNSLSEHWPPFTALRFAAPIFVAPDQDAQVAPQE